MSILDNLSAQARADFETSTSPEFATLREFLKEMHERGISPEIRTSEDESLYLWSTVTGGELTWAVLVTDDGMVVAHDFPNDPAERTWMTATALEPVLRMIGQALR